MTSLKQRFHRFAARYNIWRLIVACSICFALCNLFRLTIVLDCYIRVYLTAIVYGWIHNAYNIHLYLGHVDMQRIEDFKFLTVIIDIYSINDFSFIKQISFKKIEKYVFIIFLSLHQDVGMLKNCDKTQCSIHHDSRILCI